MDVKDRELGVAGMNQANDLSFRDILDIFSRRRRFIVRVWAIALALGAVASLAMRPPYRATSAITADRTPPVILLDQPGLAAQNLGGPVGVASPDVPTLVALAQSEQVRARASARLSGADAPAAARAVLAGVRAQPLRNTQLVRVSVDAGDPVAAAEAANAVTASLIDMDLTARRRWTREMRQSIQEQLVAADPRLRAAEDALAAYKARFGSAPLSGTTVTALDRLAQLEAQRVDVALQRQEAAARIEAARSRLSHQAQVSPNQWKPSPLIATLQSELATQEIEMAGLRRQFTPKHPAVLAATGRIAQTKQKLDAELAHSLRIDQYGVDPVYQQLAQQLKQDEVANAAMEARDRALSGAIAQYEDTVRQLPVREIGLARLARGAKEAEAIHQMLTDKLQQALAAEASIGSVIRVIDIAQAPVAPIRPRFLGLLMGAILGLAFGLGGAFLKEKVEDPLKSVEDGERVLGRPVLGVIPRMSVLNEEGSGDAPGQDGPSFWERLVAGPGASARSQAEAERWRSAFVESFRYLRTNLLCLHKRPLRTLLVTSPGHGEGKDLVAANLAVAFAQAGLRVWLVDCDLRRPALARVPAFRNRGRNGHGGIAALLGAGRPERQLIQPAAEENLWFLPAGTPPANPSELLGGERMRAFLQQDRDDVDMIVLVAPPVLPVADAAVLAQAVEGVLLVVHIGTTPRGGALRARKQLDAVGAQVVGTVLNGAPMDGFGSYFHYYASYYGTEPHGAWYFGLGHSRGSATPATPALDAALRRGLILPVLLLHGVLDQRLRQRLSFMRSVLRRGLRRLRKTSR
jgi:polysaccharide biosynthesis transport protein